MHYFIGCGANDIYHNVVDAINKLGESVSPRGIATKEICPAVVQFTDPIRRFLMVPGRNINPFFQVMESIWILGGRGDVAWISRYLKAIERYSDGKKEFNAPYGSRMRYYGYHRSLADISYVNNKFAFQDQFYNCFKFLSNDPYSRHATMVFWDPRFDNPVIETIDRPCNVAFHFLIRNEALSLSIFNRSNDVHWGLFNANVVQFSIILEAMAFALGVKVGLETHFIDSLHYYVDNPITDSILSLRKKFINIYDVISPKKFHDSCPQFDKSTNAFTRYSFLCDEIANFFNNEYNIYEYVNNKKRKPPLIKEDGHILYFRDASYLSCIFWLMINKQVDEALDLFNELEYDDIFITCLEYVYRRFLSEYSKISTIENLVSSRFMDILNKNSIKQSILNYIFSSSMQEK